MDNYGRDPNIYQYYEDPHAQQQNMYQHQQGQVRAYNAPPVPGEADAEPEESYPDGNEFLSNDYVSDVDASQYDNLPSAVSYIPPEPQPVQHPKTVLEELPGIFEEEPDIDEPVPATTEKRKPNQKKKKKKKKSKRRHGENQKEDKAVEEKQDSEKENAVEAEIEYVEEKIAMDEKDPYYKQFARVFQAFKIADLSVKTEEELELEKKKRQEEAIKTRKVPKFGGEDEEDMSEKKKEDDDKPKLSKRKLKLLTRLSVAELKQVVARPDVVEMHDVTARDPTLLVILKSTRNTVPVPRHWCAKRKYLQGKRGFEKPPFELPHFIKKTGIQEMRGAVQEKEDAKSLKAKMRERIRPKMGKIDIDYQKLHDAFFKWQTKPKMTIHGDLYYEGKEFETRLKEKKPGELSEELRTALGMPTGPNAHKIPPPWLIAMQRYGPPPSYPNLKIPGLNAPIPDSCSFGYHAGGWGKPPVDETGRPLYGDVFGYYSNDQYANLPEEEVDRTLWGELESEEEEEEEEESEEESAAAPEDTSGMATPAEGLITPAASGTTSVPAGMETPDMIELRKKKIEAEMEMGEMPSLYTVIPEKRVEKVGAAMMGSTHVYDISVTNTKNAGVDVALDPSELELDSEALAARYEQTLKDQGHISKEDVSDLIAPHVSKNKGKRKKPVPHDSNKPAKKYKEFKF